MLTVGASQSRTMISRRVGAGSGSAKKCFLRIRCCTCSFFLDTKDAIKLLLSQQKKLIEREISNSSRNKEDIQRVLENTSSPVSRTPDDPVGSEPSFSAFPSSRLSTEWSSPGQGPSSDPKSKRQNSSRDAEKHASLGTYRSKKGPFATPFSSFASRFSLLALADSSCFSKRPVERVLASLHGEPLAGSRRQRGEFAPQAPNAEMADMLNRARVECPACHRSGRWAGGKR